jgi:1-aminocyclopropane-1-carboxylate deaminase/D-cysteine desulfhydrase-like pyridoxal-dependent ACC family enzyme
LTETNIFAHSPLEWVSLDGAKILIKRDDLLHQDFSGNKARKFHYYLDNHFPHIDTIISHGSNQSNAMYSLSVLAKMRQWKFYYHTDHVSSFLRDNPSGNYKHALENNMLITTNPLPDKFGFNALFIPEGGALKEAQFGIKHLADELNHLQNINIFLPSGTGTTALYLQKYTHHPVHTCACVGNKRYLEKQFYELEPQSNTHPTILKTSKKYHFGKPYKELYETWQDVCEQTNIIFDLLYDPIGWQCVRQYNLHKSDKTLLYIHQGGVLGNESLLQRYNRKFNI